MTLLETDGIEVKPLVSEEPPPYDPRKLNLYRLSALISEARRAVAEEIKRSSQD